MAGMYSIKDLLTLIEDAGAQEMRLRPGEPPVMISKGQSRSVAVHALTADDITELLKSLATDDQLRELQACGDTRFIYQSGRAARFSIVASLKGEELRFQIRNLRV
jgi:Tfp pilus assembly pilus retraction ATPase PilT